MTTGKLYQEAINEANDLVRMAEERAKDKLIESVMPRIRELLEKKILEGEDVDEDVEDLLLSTDDDTDDEDVDTGEDFEELEPQAPAPEQAPMLTSSPPVSPPVSSVDSSLDITIPKSVGKVTLSVTETKSNGEKDKSIQLDESNIQDLIKLIDGRGTLVERARSIQLELKMLRRELDTLSDRRKQLRAGDQIVEEFNAVLRKSIGLKQEIKDAVPGPLAESAKLEFTKIEKEIKEMSTKTLLRSLLSEGPRGKINEETEEMEMKEADAEGEEAPAVEPAEEGGDEDVDVDAVKSALDTLAAAIGMKVVDEEGGADEDMGDLDMGDEEGEEKEEGMTYEFDEMSMSEGDGEEEGDMSESEEEELDEGDVFEIDESMLRTELKRLRSLREAANAATAMASHFGGGKAGKDAFESPAKLNANESGKGKGRGRPKVEKVEEAEEEKDSEKVEESRLNRELAARLDEAAKAITALNRQLAEQKLFNAKLLYVNKLMQSSSLTDKQFRSIVEALDSAKNLREAHLLYTSLSESLVKTGRSISEGVRTAGGSSRPVGTKSSGTTLNEGAIVDRWAILAGIK
jgi:hypothetical protein